MYMHIGMDPPDALTVWVALTESNLQNGCVQFSKASHLKVFQTKYIFIFECGNKFTHVHLLFKEHDGTSELLTTIYQQICSVADRTLKTCLKFKLN
jgi:hypothetical protein